MQLKVKLDDGAYMPERAHATDAGADIRTPVDVEVPAKGSAVVHTGVHVELPPGHAATGEFVEIPTGARMGGGWQAMECHVSVRNGERNIDFEGVATPEVLDAILDMMRKVVSE